MIDGSKGHRLWRCRRAVLPALGWEDSSAQGADASAYVQFDQGMFRLKYSPVNVQRVRHGTFVLDIDCRICAFPQNRLRMPAKRTIARSDAVVQG